MPAHPADSTLYARLLGDTETSRLFTDAAEIRAMLRVEGALARVQGEMGLIPAGSGEFLSRAAEEVAIDPAALAEETGANGVPVPALVAAFRAACGAPDHAQWAHWGATSQDIADTGLVLRLREALDLWDGRIRTILRALAAIAAAHADTPMAARTYGQAAVPTSFGAVAAGWGAPFLRLRERMADLRPRLLSVQFGGAAGTLAALGPEGPAVRAGLARVLGLSDPGEPWHSGRDRIAELAGLAAALATAAGKIGEDLTLLAQTGIAEVGIAGAGGSSTMPQKENPVAAAVLVALARSAQGLAATLAGAGLHRQARDGAAWFTEWLTLPPLMVTVGAGLRCLSETLPRLRPDPTAMARALDADGGLIAAEAVTFALARHMPRPEAQAAVKALAAEARKGGGSLAALVSARFPGLGLPEAPDLGEAPALARRFAAAVATS